MKQTKRQTIPVYRMDTETPLGMEFDYLEMTNEYDEIMANSRKNEVHRDEYYLFLFLNAAEAIDRKSVV